MSRKHPKPVVILPYVSCICPTYNRCPQYQFLLEETIESFVRQDYPAHRRELIILNDTEGQELRLPGSYTNVKIVNKNRRYRTLGEKYNDLVALSIGDLIAPWEDDDISLPWRISHSVQQIQHYDYYKPTGHWYYPYPRDPVPDYGGAVRHNCSLYRKSTWNALSGYPATSGNQDHLFDMKLRGVCCTPESEPPTQYIFDRPEPERLFYLYRWGVSNCHLSGSKADPIHSHQAFYDQWGRKAIVRADFLLNPHWRIDYTALIERLVPTKVSQ